MAAEIVSIVLARAGEAPGFDINLGGEDSGGAVEGEGILANPPSTMNGGDARIGFDGRKMLQDNIGLYERESGMLDP